MPDVLDIVVVLEHVEHLLHVLDVVLVGQLDVAVLGQHLDLCGEKLVAEKMKYLIDLFTLYFSIHA